MRLLVEAANRSVGVADGRIVPPSGEFDITLRIPGGEIRPGLINAHDHLHRNHYGRMGSPPYPNAYAWGRDIHARLSGAIEQARALPRREALLRGAWKNLRAGVTTVVHHDPWEPDFDAGFPIRVVRVRSAHSLGFEPELGGLGSGPGPFAIHLAEGTDQDAADEVRELARRGLLTPDLLAVHVVGPDDDGVRRLRECGAALVWCPTSNLFLFGRTAPAGLLAAGMDVLLGSDSLLTGTGDLLDELRSARHLGLVSDERLVAAVGPLAARRLGLPVPALEAGEVADLIVLRRPLLEAGSDDVALVMVAGAVRVLDPALLPALGSLAGQGAVVESAGVARWLGTSAPVVSIILPTYNREALLREAVESVAAQTFTDWELIVADDGSTDGTRAYLEGLHDPRIRPLFLEHRGTPTHPRIAALPAARGRWVAFIDSDDVWLPDKLAVQLGQLADHPECRWSYTAYGIVDGQGTPIPPRPPTPFLARSGWILEDLLTYTVSAWIVTVLVQRSLLEEVGGFDGSLDFRSDFDLAVRLAARSEVCAVAETLAVLRDHSGRSTSGQRPAELFQTNARVFRKAGARQCAAQLAEMARRLSLESEYRAAFAAIAGALRESPRSREAWRAGAGCVARALGWRRRT